MSDKTIGYIQQDSPSGTKPAQYSQILTQVLSILDDLCTNRENFSISCDANTFKTIVEKELMSIKTNYMTCNLSQCNFRLEINSSVDYKLTYGRYPLYITFLQSK